MYQALPEAVSAPVDPPGGAQILLVIEVPGALTGSTAEAMRLADEFGTAISHWLPGVQARKAVLSAPATPAHSVDDHHPPTGLSIDLANRRISVDGQPVRLAYREYALFAYLAAIPHQTVSRATLLRHVWSDRHQGTETLSGRTVDTHIRRLRAKLGDHARVLTTVRGRGYRFDPGVDVHLSGRPARELAN